MAGITVVMVTSFKRVYARTVVFSAPKHMAGHMACLARDSWTLTGKSGSVSCEVTAPFSWVGLHKVLFVLSKSLFLQFCGHSVIKSHWSSNSLGVLSPFGRSPVWEICCGP